MHRVRRRLIRVAIFCAMLLLWQLAATASPRLAFNLGSPYSVAVDFWDLLIHGDFATHFAITACEAAGGLLTGMVIGTAAGLGLWYSRNLAEIVKPFVIAAGAVPVFAFAPIMIIWFGIGIEMKIVMAAFATVFTAFSQAYQGATQVSSDLVEIMRAFRATSNKIFVKVIFPGSLGWVLNSMRLNVGFALMGAFIGEFVSSERGLGHLIQRSASLYDMPRAIAAALGLVLLALSFDALARMIEGRSFWIVQFVSVPRLIWRSRKRHEP